VASLGGRQHPTQVLVVLLGHLLRRASYLFNVNFLHHLQHLIYTFVFKLVVPDAVDHLQVVVYGLPQVARVNVLLLLPVGVLRHIEGVVHLFLEGLAEVGHEALQEVEGVEVPGELAHVVERVLFIIEVVVALDLGALVLFKYFAPLLGLVLLRLLLFLLDCI
jgi:hypothetical protein